MAFLLALREGKAKPFSIKLLLVGAENVGKSCCVDTLVGVPFEECEATEGADLAICNTSNWVKISQEEASQRLQNKYLCNLKSCADSKTIAAEKDFSERCASAENVGKKIGHAEVHVQAKGKRSFFTKVVRLFRSHKKPQQHHANSLTPDETRATHKQETPTVNEDEIHQAKFTVSTDVQEEDGVDVTILDLAGQLQYHNTHSAFIRKNNIVMVVFNASQPLSQNINVRPTSLRSHSMTNSQNIHFWMKTVHSICHEPGDASDKASLLPIIMFVATHLDLLGDSAEETKEQIIHTLADELEGKPYAKHLAGHGEGLLNALRKYCIFLSNKKRDHEIIQLLQSTVIEIATPILSKEQPIVFLKIERMLLSSDKGVISKEEFHAITYDCGFLAAIGSEEFSFALQYFHNRGTILHFASVDSLKRLVILSPHWLTKLFSYILIAHPYQRIGGDHDNAFRNLTRKGILACSLIIYMLEVFNSLEKYASFEIELKQAIHLMKKFYFVAQIDHTTKFLEGVKIGNEKELYIVPSLLPVDPLKKNVPESHHDNVKTVYFYLPDRFIPPMLFSQMMAMCINRNKDKKEDILW